MGTIPFIASIYTNEAREQGLQKSWVSLWLYVLNCLLLILPKAQQHLPREMPSLSPLSVVHLSLGHWLFVFSGF